MKYTDAIYGEFEFSGIIKELINTRVFQRLKKIHQGGAIVLVEPTINHTRFDHSIGVMLLIKRLGGNIEEQLAGLVHDISHTAFSHLIDYVLDVEEEDYHEKRYKEVLFDKELIHVLGKYNIEVNDLIDLRKFKMVEFPLPGLSADRIDYTLRDLFQLGKISIEEIDWFLSGLTVFENRIVVTGSDFGYWFKSKYDNLVSQYFNSRANIAVNAKMKELVKACMEKGVIEEKDFFKDDYFLIEKMKRTVDLEGQLVKIRNGEYDNLKIKTKSRVIDPEILVNNRLEKLSELK